MTLLTLLIISICDVLYQLLRTALIAFVLFGVSYLVFAFGFLDLQWIMLDGSAATVARIIYFLFSGYALGKYTASARKFYAKHKDAKK